MKRPGEVEKLQAHILNTRDMSFDLKFINDMAGGSDQKWGVYLRGARCSANVRAVNCMLVANNLELVSMGAEKYDLFTCAEAHLKRAGERMEKLSRPLKLACQSILAVLDDERATPVLRNEAKAWLELLETEAGQATQTIFIEWCMELNRKLPGRPHLQLV